MFEKCKRKDRLQTQNSIPNF